MFYSQLCHGSAVSLRASSLRLFLFHSFSLFVYLDCKVSRAGTVSYYVFIQSPSQWGLNLGAASRHYWNIDSKDNLIRREKALRLTEVNVKREVV